MPIFLKVRLDSDDIKSIIKGQEGKMTETEIANKFASDHGVMVSFCESCGGWYVHCAYCNNIVCCYYKFCCFTAFMLQEKLDKAMERK